MDIRFYRMKVLFKLLAISQLQLYGHYIHVHSLITKNQGTYIYY